MVGDAIKPLPDEAGIAGVHLAVGESPIILIFEEEGLAIGPRKGGVNPPRQSFPKFGDIFRISGQHGVLGEFPEHTPLEGVGAVLHGDDRVNGRVFTQVLIRRLGLPGNIPNLGHDSVCLGSVQRLDGHHVIAVQADLLLESSVEGRHEGAVLLGVGEAQAVPELVGRGLQQVGARPHPHGPGLRVVKVDVAAIHREEGVGQGPAVTVKCVSIPVLPVLEPDVHVDLAALLLLEAELSDI